MLEKGQTVWVLTQDENSEETFYTECYFDYFDKEYDKYFVSRENPLVDCNHNVIAVNKEEISVYKPLELNQMITVIRNDSTIYNQLVIDTRFKLKNLNFRIISFEITKFKPVYIIDYYKINGFSHKFKINHKDIEVIKKTQSNNSIDLILAFINFTDDLDYYVNEKHLIEFTEKTLPIISFDEYFMGVALLSEMRSKDPVTRVGACIVKNKKIIGIGYNGFPNGCDDKDYSWSKLNANPLENKYAYVVHAELNAILNSNGSLDNSTLYCSLYPCNECAKAIIQAGIKEVVYNSKKDNKTLDLATERMFKSANINVRLFENNKLFFGVKG